MRKLCAALAGGLLALMLAGCGGGEGTSSLSSTLAESAQGALEDAESELEVMTVEEAVDTFKTIPPAKLGLEGESWAEYDVIHNQASVPVDGVPCLEITVYTKNDAANTNSPVGTFLFARDGTAMYQLDVATDTLTKLDY